MATADRWRPPPALADAVRRLVAARGATYASSLGVPGALPIPEAPRRLQNSVLFPFAFQDLGGRVGFVIKAIDDPDRPQGAPDEFRNLGLLHRWFAGSAFGVPQPLDHLPELNAIVTERIYGQCAQEIVRRGSARWRPRARGRAQDVCRLAGAWLAELQNRTSSCTDDGGQTRPPRASGWPDSLRAAFDRATRRGLPDDLASELESVLARRPASRGPESWTHSDYSPQNVFATGDALYVIDFAEAPRGAVEDSAAFYWARLELAKRHPMLDPTSLSACQSAFLQGFDRPLSREWEIWGLLRQFSYLPLRDRRTPLAVRWLRGRSSAWAISSLMGRLRDRRDATA